MSSKFDYEALEREYIEGPDDLTPRKMAERDGASFSAYYSQYRKRDWLTKRERFREMRDQKVMKVVTDTISIKAAQIKSDALDVIHAAVMKMGLDLADRTLKDGTVVPGQTVTPGDLAKLIDKLMLLTGNPTTINENRNLGIDLTDRDLPPDVARLLAEVAGERGTASRSVGRAALPGSRATGPN